MTEVAAGQDIYNPETLIEEHPENKSKGEGNSPSVSQSEGGRVGLPPAKLPSEVLQCGFQGKAESVSLPVSRM